MWKPFASAQNPSTEATPMELELYRRNVKTWDYRVDFLGRAPHSLIVGDDFSSESKRNWGANDESLYTRGNGRWDFVSTGPSTVRITAPGRCAGPCWVAYIIIDKLSRPANLTNLIDVGVSLFNGTTNESKQIRARLWSTDARHDVCVSIDQSPPTADTGEFGVTEFTPGDEPFALALVCNLNSLAVAIGDKDGKNFRLASGWHTLTTFDMATDLIRFGSPANDGNGGLCFTWYCETSHAGMEFGITKAEWRYWDGVGTRETYLLSDLDGNPIIENGKVWMTTDRTMPYDPAGTFLPNGAQITACQYDPSNGEIGQETARFFYKADGRTTPMQNSKLVWDHETNSFHVYAPDWKEAPAGVNLLYACVRGVDLRYGVHVIEPVPMSFPSNEHFTFNPASDFLFDAAPMRIAHNDYLILLSWIDSSRPFPENYSRVLLRGNSPSNFTEIVGWDPDHGGEGHRLIRMGGRLFAICGSVQDRTKFHVWEIIPGENWMSYLGERYIEGFNWGRGDTPHYPGQIEMWGMPTADGQIEYHFTTFGVGQFGPTEPSVVDPPAMPATQGSFFSARSQKFPLL